MVPAWPALAVSAAAVLALTFPLAANNYLLHVTIIAIFYAILASSWALLAGYAGQFSFAHMAFAALGGYTSALLVADLRLRPLGMLAEFSAAASAGAAMGFCCLRLAGPYLSLFTLAFAVIFQLALIAEYEVTRGSLELEVLGLFAGCPRLEAAPRDGLGADLAASSRPLVPRSPRTPAEPRPR